MLGLLRAILGIFFVTYFLIIIYSLFVTFRDEKNRRYLTQMNLQQINTNSNNAQSNLPQVDPNSQDYYTIEHYIPTEHRLYSNSELYNYRFDPAVQALNPNLLNDVNRSNSTAQQLNSPQKDPNSQDYYSSEHYAPSEHRYFSNSQLYNYRFDPATQKLNPTSLTEVYQAKPSPSHSRHSINENLKDANQP